MPRNKKPDEFDIYAEDYGQDALEEFLELREEFPELEEFLEDILELDDEDFYTTTVH